MVKCGDDERDFRMKSDPETFFITDHYRGYPTVLVRLARAGRRRTCATCWRRPGGGTLSPGGCWPGVGCRLGRVVDPPYGLSDFS